VTTYDFTKDNVDKAPAAHGAYILYDGGELIYIGRASGNAVTIRSRLQCHLRGDEGPCTQGATHYWREPNDSPIAREKELLDWYAANNKGQLPRCNERRA